MNANWNYLVVWLNQNYPEILEHFEKVLAGEEE
jgi:hypothetical protein